MSAVLWRLSLVVEEDIGARDFVVMTTTEWQRDWCDTD